MRFCAACVAAVLLTQPLWADSPAYRARVAVVVRTPGFVAFWDFVKREPDGAKRFLAHVPAGARNEFPLDAGNYVRDYWGAGRAATYDDFPLLGRGPFGQAVRVRQETDADFRPFLFVPRSRLHDSPLDIKGEGKAVTLIVWAIRERGNHALAGIWHEGTDLRQESGVAATRVERGQRQYALFAGLNVEGAARGHLSENGASSFADRYAMHKSNTLDLSPAIPADSLPELLNANWQVFAMTFDPDKRELTAWLNGLASERWQDDVKTKLQPVYNAWRQGELRKTPGIQPGEAPSYPADQFYSPPEDAPVSVKVLSESGNERVELREYRYTRVEVTLRKDGAAWAAAGRDLAAVRLNPWWYPHGIYTPPDAMSGGPFTIGRVIHSSRSVGFTGWIGGVAVFGRALTAREMAQLAAAGRDATLARKDAK